MNSSEDRTATTSRRRFLRGAAGTAAGTVATAAGATPAAAQQFGGWFEDVPNYAGEVVDMTGQAEVTVEVGVETANGPYGFGPPAIRVDPGTSVTFAWVSDAHNVLPEEQPEGVGWEGHETIENTGFEFSSTFETEGVYLYYCEPHLPLGMKGAVVVGADAGGGDGTDGDGSGEQAGTPWLTPGVVMVGGAIAAAAVSAVVFGLFLLLDDRSERATDGGPGGVLRADAAGGAGTDGGDRSEPARGRDHEEFDRSSDGG